MLDKDAEPVRWEITHEFGLWTSRNAMSGFARWWGRKRKKNLKLPKLSMTLADVRCHLEAVDFDVLFDREQGAISLDDFFTWNHKAVNILLEREPILKYGWAAKMIAVYLKTTCYLAGFGRDGLDEVVHPPLDNELRNALAKREWVTPGLKMELKKAAGISIVDIKAEVYLLIIVMCIEAARELDCKLIELEQFWNPGSD